MGASVLELLRQVLSGVFVAGGLVFVAGGTLGLLRFPDFYTRLHATTTADGVGAVLVLLGLALGAASATAALKLALLAAIVAALTATMAHVAANTAHAAGLAPLAGPYTAPRPGQPRKDVRS